MSEVIKYPEGDKMNCPLEWVLSVTTGVLLTEVGNVHRVLDFATKQDLFTHQLPRAAEACQKQWLEEFPELKFDTEPTPETYQDWLLAAKIKLGERFIVTRLNDGAYEPMSPVGELEQKMKGAS